MRNRRAIFSVLTSSIFVSAVVFVACKDDTPSEFTDPKDDGGNVPDRVQGFKTDGNSELEGGPKVECKPSLPTTFKATFVAPVKQEACTAAQIDGYYKACLPNLDEQPCKDFLAANADCVKCIEAPDAKGPLQIYTVNNIPRYYYTLNHAGCIGLVTGKTGDDSCAKAFDTAVNCRRAACDACFTQEGAQYENFTDCQVEAAGSNACKTYETESASKCPNYRDADGGAPDCFSVDVNEDNQKLFTRLANTFCLKK